MERMTIPCENGDNYLTRLRVIQTPWFGVYLHDIESPDSDPHPHDHPWNFRSFIVKGGYTEKVYPLEHSFANSRLDPYRRAYERRWNRFTWHKMTKNNAHRITQVLPGTVSLILVGKRSSSWGFYLGKEDYMDWKEYESVYRSV